MIRILLVDDHTMFRAGIKSLLRFQADMEVVGEAECGQSAIVKYRELAPDVVVMDIAMAGLDGISATRLLKEINPKARILLLTQHENKEYIIPALKMGASGYVLKRAAADDLVSAIRSVFNEKCYLDPSVSEVIVRDYHRTKEAGEDGYSLLTDREREILTYLSKGHTNREIAQLLCISAKTVDFHRTNLMRKLGIHNRVELTKYAMRKGLV